VFAIAAATYLLTLEPTVCSDCGEFRFAAPAVSLLKSHLGAPTLPLGWLLFSVWRCDQGGRVY
jgi:hypothetical protein